MNVTQNVLLRILRSGDKTITSLIKLCYLIDLVSVKETNNQITSFEYIRYNYGPFDKNIYSELQEMQINGVVKSCNRYSNSGDDGEHIVLYGACGDYEAPDNLTDAQRGIIDKVLTSLEGFGPKNLTELAYKTKPMVAFNATLGGTEHMGEKLNLKA